MARRTRAPCSSSHAASTGGISKSRTSAGEIRRRDDETAAGLLALAGMRWRDFSRLVLEAMQQARPCLVSNLPGSGLPWVVEQAGAGMSVALQDVAAWRTAISSLQADPALRARLGAAGQEALPRLFGIDACATRILALYGSVQPDLPAAPYPMASHTNAAPQQSDTLIVIPARD